MRMFVFALTVAMAVSAQAAAPIPPDAVARIGQADANRDGNVTRAELIAWRAANFARFDRNGDNVLSDADIPMFLRSSALGTQFRDLQVQFDVNRDKKVTRDEFVNGPTAVFDAVDANRDSVVTKAEIDAASAQARAAKGR